MKKKNDERSAALTREGVLLAPPPARRNQSDASGGWKEGLDVHRLGRFTSRSHSAPESPRFDNASSWLILWLRSISWF